MELNEYQKLALRSARKNMSDREALINGVMGLSGEAGEVIDLVKKHLYHEHPLEKEKLAKELGDVAWYLARTADVLGYTLEEICNMNLEKLQKRYPDGFDVERSKHRDAE